MGNRQMRDVIPFPSGLSRHVKVTVFYNPSEKVLDVRADSGAGQGKNVGKTLTKEGNGIYLSDVKFDTEDGMPVIKGTYLGEAPHYLLFIDAEVAEFVKGRWIARSGSFRRGVSGARMVSIIGNIVIIDIADD